jgi:hypothetical protein
MYGKEQRIIQNFVWNVLRPIQFGRPWCPCEENIKELVK